MWCVRPEPAREKPKPGGVKWPRTSPRESRYRTHDWRKHSAVPQGSRSGPLSRSDGPGMNDGDIEVDNRAEPPRCCSLRARTRHGRVTRPIKKRTGGPGPPEAPVGTRTLVNPRTKGPLPLDRPSVISLSVAEPPHRGRGTHIPPGANRDRSRRRYPPPSPTAHLAGRTGGSRYVLWTGIWDGRGASSAPSGGISGST